MKRRQIVLYAALALLTGCATKEMASTPFYTGDEIAYTGRIEDRVNLWPLAYWREPVGSMLWPMISFGGDQFAIRPLYSQYGRTGDDRVHEVNFLWPLCHVDRAQGRGWFFPFIWGPGSFEFTPLVGYNQEGNWAFPFYRYRRDSFGVRFSFAAGLGGRFAKQEGISHWLMPLWLSDEKGFYSIPYTRMVDGENYLCGLAGRRHSPTGEYTSSWVLPFYYHAPNELQTPLFGWSDDSNWVFPIFYKNTNGRLDTPLFSYVPDDDDGMRKVITLPVLSGYSWNPTNAAFRLNVLLGTAGWASDAAGARQSQWLFPLFYREDGRSFATLPFGWLEDEEARYTWWATPLVGSGEGWNWKSYWVAPFYYQRQDRRLDAYRQLMDSPRLDESIEIRDSTSDFCRVNSFRAERSCQFLCGLGGRVNESVVGYSCYLSAKPKEIDGYRIVDSRQWGNRLIFNSTFKRAVDFDLQTRERRGESVSRDDSLFFFLYTRTGAHNVRKDSERDWTRHRVLWKLWDWYESEGNVALDVFPGFAYDSKANGYRKVSLFWRLFRYENDPEKGVSADFLFLPVLRP